MCQHKSISILNGDFSGKQTNKTNNNNKKKKTTELPGCQKHPDLMT